MYFRIAGPATLGERVWAREGLFGDMRKTLRELRKQYLETRMHIQKRSRIAQSDTHALGKGIVFVLGVFGAGPVLALTFR